VAAEDVARVVAMLLANPQPHIGKVYQLTGPQSETMEFYAQEYSKALGRTITYQDIPVGPCRDGLMKNGLPVHLVNHLAAMTDLHRAGRYDRMSDDVQTLTGQVPLSVQEFVSGGMRRHSRRRQKWPEYHEAQRGQTHFQRREMARVPFLRQQVVADRP
jgi:hypothetical protein